MDRITDTFVLLAPDSPTKVAIVPKTKGDKRPIHLIQYELLTARPYELTLEELIFAVHVERAGLAVTEVKRRKAEIWAELFSRSHACMRASALPKKFGWGVHYDSRGKLALFAAESADYRRFASGKVCGVTLVAALRTKRA
jgi:uncharacterized protein DUF6157